MNFLDGLKQLLGGAEHAVGNIFHPQQAPQAPIGPMGTPTSAPIPSFMGNQYAQNPQAAQFRGVDPMIFGYPADNSSGLQVRPPQPISSEQMYANPQENAFGGGGTAGIQAQYPYQGR